ncbi:MAG: hypothetical protein QOF89_1030 [Acidobacteriota bacterium]|jgi:hypothetical protein|nr:hypothetical protein [Acidobacteriota bacterium]
MGAAGTYNWAAIYNGDINNNAVTSPSGSEPFTVTPPPTARTPQRVRTGSCPQP